jgi:ArsR family transcriptional regulator
MKVNHQILPLETASFLADFFSAFSDTSRVRIISVLSCGEMNVGSIADAIGISESAVSHHLRSLRQLRIVKSRKKGRFVYYCLDDQHVIEIYNSGVQHVEHE